MKPDVAVLIAWEDIDTIEDAAKTIRIIGRFARDSSTEDLARRAAQSLEDIVERAIGTEETP